MSGSLDDLPPLREVIAEHGLSAKKALGQNFLLDANLLDRIARIPGDLDGAHVYEVGPGPGGLTRALLRAGAKVTAVEMDARCIPILESLAAVSPGHLTVIAGDAMTVDEAASAPGAHVLANLPYNVGTALLVRWMEGRWPPWWQSLTLMFQKEVAERIVAAPGQKAYGRLSVLSQWRAVPRIALRLKPSAFVPPPKVESAVVHITPKSEPHGVAAETIARLTGHAFQQRRKMLRSSLKSWPEALDALEAVGIGGDRRPETVPVADFVAAARLL